MQKTRPRGFWLHTVVVVIFAQLLVSEASAQSYPTRIIRLVTGSGVGGGGDFTTRLVAQKMPQFLGGPPIVVENRPGASNLIGAALVAKSPADGYTLALLTNSIYAAALMEKPPLNLERDLVAVSMVAVAPSVLVVHPSVPVRNIKELIALARAHPAKLNYGTSGIGSAGHMQGALFNYMAKVETVHVPYKEGGSISTAATASGELEMTYDGVAAARPFIEAGKVRALAVTGAKRSILMPSLPTIEESGVPGYDRTSWYGMFAPVAVPKDIITQLNAAVNRTVNSPDAKEALIKQGIEPQATTPEQFAAYLRSEIAVFVKLAKLIGLKAE